MIEWNMMPGTWQPIAFEDIKAGDRIRFTYTDRYDITGKTIEAVAHQDTLINTWHAQHPASWYVNVQFEGVDYTRDWEHQNDTVYGPTYKRSKWGETVPSGPSMLCIKHGRIHDVLGTWTAIDKYVEEEVTAKDQALAKVKEAEKQLAEARKLLEEADKQTTREQFTRILEAMSFGTVFCATAGLKVSEWSDSVTYFKVPGKVIARTGEIYSNTAFVDKLILGGFNHISTAKSTGWTVVNP